LLANTERSFTEFGWMLSEDNQETVRQSIIQGKSCLDSRNLDDISATFDALEVGARMITEAMFNPANAGPPPDQNSQHEPKALPE
jgi:molecular chaperone DnaK